MHYVRYCAQINTVEEYTINITLAKSTGEVELTDKQQDIALSTTEQWSSLVNSATHRPMQLIISFNGIFGAISSNDYVVYLNVPDGEAIATLPVYGVKPESASNKGGLCFSQRFQLEKSQLLQCKNQFPLRFEATSSPLKRPQSLLVKEITIFV